MFSRIRTVPIAKCVHYCGFLYGRDRFNPYENYILGLSRGESIARLRSNFVDFIQHYRPKTLGEALSVSTENSVDLWLLPWKSWRKLFRQRGWVDSPDDVVDILTHFSPQGVHWSRIEEEFMWLERAWENISKFGYQPDRHSYIDVFELRGETESRFLVVDGNHRLSALRALGHEEVLVKQHCMALARRCLARYWPLVLTRHLSLTDALVIFDAYFQGNVQPYHSSEKATILY